MWFPLSPRRRRPGWNIWRGGGLLSTAVPPIDDLFGSLQQPLALFDSSPLDRTLCFDCIEGVSCTRHSGSENEGEKEEAVCESPDASDLSMLKPTFASASDSWLEFYSGMQEGDCDGIEEVFIDVLTSKTSVARPPVKHDGPRRRYERFREKRFTCDYCDRTFTLKQNVQVGHYFFPTAIK
jgi:hypothetical protein